MKFYQGERSRFISADGAVSIITTNGNVRGDEYSVGLPLTDIIGFLGELGYVVITKDDATSAANALFDQERDFRTKGLTLTADEKHETWRRVCLASLPQKPLTKREE